MKLTKEHLYDAVEQLKCCIDEHTQDAEGLIYLSQTDYDTLLETGTVTTPEGKTYTYDATAYYAVDEPDEPVDPPEKLYIKDSVTGKTCEITVSNGQLSVYVPTGELDKAIVCFIDDDAQTSSDALFSAFQTLGVPWGIAAPINSIGTSGNYSVAQLKAFEAFGADVIVHGVTSTDNYKTITASQLAADLDTQITWAETNGFSTNTIVYPQGIQPTESNFESLFPVLQNKGITYGFNVNTSGESSSITGLEDWYTYANGSDCGGRWNKVPFVDMPNGYSKALLLNRFAYSKDSFYKRKSYWFSSYVQPAIDAKGLLVFFTHGASLSTSVTTYDGETLTLLESYTQFIQYLKTNYADQIEILSPLAALAKISR